MTQTCPIAFGTMQFGGNADEAASRAMFDACRAAGVTHFDTANGYTEGRSETLLGRFAAAERDKLFIATKVGYDSGEQEVLVDQFARSLDRLRMGQVDLLYLHRFHPEVPLEETLEVFAEFQAQGKIRQIGLSNFPAWAVMKAQAVAHRLGTRIDAIQPMYNLVKRQAEVELLPMAMDQGIAVYPYSPLGGGLLSGKYAAGGAGRLSTDSRYAARYAPQTMHETARALTGLAAELGTHPATLAVAWVMAHPARPVPLTSARNVAQLAPSLAALSFPMTAAIHARISTLSPSPPPATDRLEEA
jgi:aryl-alcohol dehydrogenase-like predicted oxidoreductase